MSGLDQPGSTSKSKQSLGIAIEDKRMGTSLVMTVAEREMLVKWLRLVHNQPYHYENWLGDNVLRPWFDANKATMKKEILLKEVGSKGSIEDMKAIMAEMDRKKAIMEAHILEMAALEEEMNKGK
jgi:hypothetical protein